MTKHGGIIATEFWKERLRQINEEGHDADHDDKYVYFELAEAAAAYATGQKSLWPWHYDWWKPKNRRHDLVKAGALLIAEIERLDRLNEKKKSKKTS